MVYSMNVFKNKKRWKNKKTLKNVKKRALMSDVCLSYVCLSVPYFGPKSRTEAQED